ncbi:MAG: methylated-DNA--[protein]-cysteine S-methyltransferase [Dehalococcoidales bacterium]|nr:methylated-DNA--[protein]-cysteine S-methyltransferase [Dehalococcoidales bacterium]
MTGELRYITFNTNAGWLGILGSAEGLLCISLPHRYAEEALQRLGDNINQAVWSPHQFQELVERFRVYFSGHRVAFPDKLDLSIATPFQREVWEVTRLIPYGETRSYAWVAEQMGKPKAVRAVGQALGKNPLPIIIPCHRVITSDGKLGGFSEGLEMKRFLLGLETATVRLR